VISGTPGAVGTNTFVVGVRDIKQATDTRKPQITVMPPPPVITPVGQLPLGIVGFVLFIYLQHGAKGPVHLLFTWFASYSDARNAATPPPGMSFSTAEVLLVGRRLAAKLIL